MDKWILTNRQPVILAITVETSGRLALKIRVTDSDILYADYCNRIGVVEGRKTFYIRMPQSPVISLLQVENTQSRNLNEGFKILQIQELPVDVHPEFYDSKNPLVISFIKFMQIWSERAGYLSAGKKVQVIPNSFFGKDGAGRPGYFTEADTYFSDDKRFRIDYVEECVNRMTGEVSTTPMRISEDRGIIEAAKLYVRPATIPYRFCWGVHEFSHFWLNENPSDEEEADANGVKMALGLGYSPADVELAFISVFEDRDTNQNRIRHEKIHRICMDYETNYNKYK